jgi:hypothetical protein
MDMDKKVELTEMCPGPGAIGDEYATGTFFKQIVNSGGGSTCDINTILLKSKYSNRCTENWYENW